MDRKDYIDRFEAAELLGTYPRSIQRWATKGKIPYELFPAPPGAKGLKNYRLYHRQSILDLVAIYQEPINLSPDFGYYLAGLVDGEGSFGLNVRQRAQRKNKLRTYVGNEAWLKITLRDDDLPLILEVRQKTGVGIIFFHSTEQIGRKPSASWNVNRHADAVRLVHIFEQYPLRGKKRRDFEIWSQFVKERSRKDFDQTVLDRLSQDIQHVRHHVPPDATDVALANELNQTTEFRIKSYGIG